MFEAKFNGFLKNYLNGVVPRKGLRSEEKISKTVDFSHINIVVDMQKTSTTFLQEAVIILVAFIQGFFT